MFSARPMASDAQPPAGSQNPESDESNQEIADSTSPRFGSLQYTAYHAQVAANSLLINHADRRSLVPTLSAARVEILPHQVECAIAALQSPLSKGMLFGDETGLGKTVEAGTTIAQSWAERRRIILLIVPTTIRRQWHDELLSKFGLPSTLVNGPGIDRIINQHGSLIGGEPCILIMSYGVASSKASILAATPWDLVVIDEAHRLRNVFKAGPESHSRRIREALQGRRKLLLTATPLQNNLMELHGLLSFIDEDLLCSHEDFALLYLRNPQNNQLARLADIIRPVIKRHLRSDVQASGHVAFTKRIAKTIQFEPYSDEQELYELVSAYLRRPDTIAFGPRPNPLILTVARKLLASSTAAIIGFLRTVRARLLRAEATDIEALLDDVEDLRDVVEDARDLAGLRGEAWIEPGTAEAQDALQIKVPIGGFDDEIAEIDGYIALAEAIAADAKADHLVEALPEILDGVCENAGRRLAVIFTESRKTQSFLVKRLQSAGISEQIITLNGSNDDADSSRLLFEWRARHADDGSVSGSMSSDIKAAIIERFLASENALLISTESGGEGVNLQACSIIINYDLPWNPQRLEQRIGRCHRYGQKLDVLVINLQNKCNRVEERLIELLTHKFKIFEGVFGASDQVLGAIEADVDLSAEVSRMLQTCRTAEEVDRAFNELACRLMPAITSDRKEARRRLFDMLDEAVVARLQARGRNTVALFDDFLRRLAIVIRAELPSAAFLDAIPLTFSHDGTTWTTQWDHAQASGVRHLKLGDQQWRSKIVEPAASRQLPAAAVRFDLSAMRAAGFPRLSDVERYAGRAGWLSVARLSFSTAAEVIPRATLVLAGLADDGEVLDSETALRFFLVPGEVVGIDDAPLPEARLREIERSEQARLTEAAKSESAAWRIAEIEKLEAKMHDTTRAAELRAKELEDTAHWMRMRMRAESHLSAEERLKKLRDINKIEVEASNIYLSLLPKIGEMRHQIDLQFEKTEASLRIIPKLKSLSQIRWIVKSSS